MFKLLRIILCAIVVNVVITESKVELIKEVSDGIDGLIVIEQNGKQSTSDETILVTNQQIRAKVVIKNSNALKNTSFSWFIDDIAFRPTFNPEFKYVFERPKIYKLMVVILANETLTDSNKGCISKVGILSRKVNVIQQNLTKQIFKSSDDKDLILLGIKNKRRKASEGENNTIYGALIIGGAILLTLIFISILIHTISLCDHFIYRKNELKEPLIDRKIKLNPIYTP